MRLGTNLLHQTGHSARLKYLSDRVNIPCELIVAKTIMWFAKSLEARLINRLRRLQIAAAILDSNYFDKC